jgi:hypothetical protein
MARLQASLRDVVGEALRSGSGSESESFPDRDPGGAWTGVQAPPGWESAGQCEFGEDLGGVDSEVLDRLGHGFARHEILLGEGEQCSDDRAFGVDLEEAAQVGAGFGASEAVGAESEQSAGDPGGDLVGDQFHVIGDGDERAGFAGEHRFEMGPAWGCGGVEHVMAPAEEGVIAEELVAGGAPDIGGDAVAFEDFLGAEGGLMMGPEPRMWALSLGPAGPGLNL